jgi:hypothetical protein
MSQLNVCLWGRGTGKSEGPMCDFTMHNIFTMPKANGFLLGVSYQQLLSRTLPPLIASWEERYRFKEEKHFWLRKYAPKELMRPKAFRHPQDAKNYLHVYNGSGIYLASQDRPGSINGTRSAWGGIDEAKLINKQRFDEEVIPTMSDGLLGKYGHLWNYKSLLFCSDRPKTTKGKWLLEYQAMHDQEVIDSIMHVHTALQFALDEFNDASESMKNKLRPGLKALYWEMNELKKGTVYFSLANLIDNIDAVGLESLKHFKRTLKEVDFLISILNKEIYKPDNGFYPLLDDERHGYTMPNEDFIDNLVYDFKTPPVADCRWELDMSWKLPLEIAFDHNNRINSVVTCQEIGNEFRLLSALYVLSPHFLKDLCRKWSDFYNYRKNRDVDYYYDSTSKKGDAAGNLDWSEMVYQELTSQDWNVNKIDIGQIGSHHSRHGVYAYLLNEKSPELPKFRYNKTNAAQWFVSASQAGVIKRGDEIKKDKSSEKPDSGIAPEEATHISEALDVIVMGKLKPRIENQDEFMDMIY